MQPNKWFAYLLPGSLNNSTDVDEFRPVLQQHLIKRLAWMMLEEFRSKINMPLSSELIVTTTYPSWEACAVWSSRHVPASSWLLVSPATFLLHSSVIFHHLLSAVINKVFPFSFLTYFSHLHSCKMDLIRLVLFFTSVRNILHCLPVE